jgi:hypothetical protein
MRGVLRRRLGLGLGFGLRRRRLLGCRSVLLGGLLLGGARRLRVGGRLLFGGEPGVRLRLLRGLSL